MVGVSGKKVFFAATLPIAAGAGAYLMYILADSYRAKRLISMFYPADHSRDAGFWTAMIRDTMSNSVMFGTGSMIPAYYGAEDSALWKYDFILAALMHNYGWIVFFAAAVVFFAFTVAGLKRCLRQKSVLGTLVSISVMLTLTMQIVIYFSCNLGVFFGQTLALPLISGGNSTLIVDGALIGFMLSVFRTEELYGAFLTE